MKEETERMKTYALARARARRNPRREMGIPDSSTGMCIRNIHATTE
jgi:hypothetical protein